MASNIIQLIVVAIGACFGSFITAASWRLPRNEDIIVAKSHCPKCLKYLQPIDLIPVLSWALVRGKCRSCRAKVSFRYPLTEILTAAAFWGLYLKYGLTSDFIILALLTVALLIMIISDFETYIMPDSTTIAAGLLAIAFNYFHQDGWLVYIIGAVICLAVALVLKYGFLWIMKRDALGWGDIKFLPVVGLWIGYNELPVFFILSGIFGILIGIAWRIIYKNAEYPFGPALAVALLIIILFPEINSLMPALK